MTNVNEGQLQLSEESHIPNTYEYISTLHRL